jgi:hypothetical protein
VFFNTWIKVIKPSKLSTGSFESVVKWWNWPWQRLCLRLIIAFRRQILDLWYLYVYRPNIENLTQTPFITRYYLNLSKILKKSIFRVLPQNSNFARFLRTVALKHLIWPANWLFRGRKPIKALFIRRYHLTRMTPSWMLILGCKENLFKVDQDWNRKRTISHTSIFPLSQFYHTQLCVDISR